LKVFVIPHSHNDPGWLKTFEGYYHLQTKHVLDNLVDKLTEFKNMSFLWSEISFLSKWWKDSHPRKRDLMRALVKEGRLEIVTGGENSFMSNQNLKHYP
jgi:alpha-mannosidase